MKLVRSLPLLELAVLFLAAWLSRDLPGAWRHSPHDRLGWLALLIWLAPPVFFLAHSRRACAGAAFLGAAILCGFIGELAEFHFMGHLALALAVAAWIPVSLRSAVWLLAAVSWMPVFGWCLADFSAGMVLISRLALALAGAVCLWLIEKQKAL